ncbi:MAG: TolC family protein [Candidatus Obscuribacterales bacterium]|nr:TolC family protein [Candidatus Obscuribacterales bacterium]
MKKLDYMPEFAFIAFALDISCLWRCRLGAALLLILLSSFLNCQAALCAEQKLSLTPPGLKLKELPPEPAQSHELNRVLDLGPLKQISRLPLASTRPIKLEASFSEPLGLEEALRYALNYSLPIRIARESWNYQRWQFYGELADFLPSYSTNWNLTNSWIHPSGNSSNARVYNNRLSYPVFVGGNVVYTALAQYYRERGWKQSLYSSINDALLDIYRNYTNLRLNNILLQIRAKSLQVSESQLKINNALYSSGSGTQFAIMQSRTQLAADEQALLQQQVISRQAALLLAYSLNAPLAVNLVPREEALSEDRILSEKTPVEEFLQLSLNNRPELRQYELFLVAAQRNVQVAASPLYPSVGFFNSATHASTTIYQSSARKELALIKSVTAAAAARNAASASSSSGASADLSSASNASAGVFGGLTNTFQSGFSFNWSLPNLGLGNVCNIMSARALSRQAMLQANQQLLLVDQQVRTAYLNAAAARAQIDATAYGVASAKEALRLALLRLQTGVGSNLELIQAQRDYITALSNQAQAIANSNIAQAQLLHDCGIISIKTLCRGYRSGETFRDPFDKQR